MAISAPAANQLCHARPAASSSHLRRFILLFLLLAGLLFIAADCTSGNESVQRSEQEPTSTRAHHTGGHANAPPPLLPQAKTEAEAEVEPMAQDDARETKTTELPATQQRKTSHLFIVLFALLALINLIVIFGNILVIVAVYATEKLRTITNIFIVSLATADLMLGLFVLPYSLLLEVLDTWIFGHVWCRGWLVTDVWISTASILNLCAISIDRYVAVTRPVKYRSIMTAKRAKCIVALVWLVSFLICFPPLLPGSSFARSLSPVQQQQQQQQPAELHPTPVFSSAISGSAAANSAEQVLARNKRQLAPQIRSLAPEVQIESPVADKAAEQSANKTTARRTRGLVRRRSCRSLIVRLWCCSRNADTDNYKSRTPKAKSDASAASNATACALCNATQSEPTDRSKHLLVAVGVASEANDCVDECMENALRSLCPKLHCVSGGSFNSGRSCNRDCSANNNAAKTMARQKLAKDPFTTSGSTAHLVEAVRLQPHQKRQQKHYSLRSPSIPLLWSKVGVAGEGGVAAESEPADVGGERPRRWLMASENIARKRAAAGLTGLKRIGSLRLGRHLNGGEPAELHRFECCLCGCKLIVEPTKLSGPQRAVKVDQSLRNDISSSVTDFNGSSNAKVGQAYASDRNHTNTAKSPPQSLADKANALGYYCDLDLCSDINREIELLTRSSSRPRSEWLGFATFPRTSLQPRGLLSSYNGNDDYDLAATIRSSDLVSGGGRANSGSFEFNSESSVLVASGRQAIDKRSGSGSLDRLKSAPPNFLNSTDNDDDDDYTKLMARTKQWLGRKWAADKSVVQGGSSKHYYEDSAIDYANAFATNSATKNGDEQLFVKAPAGLSPNDSPMRRRRRLRRRDEDRDDGDRDEGMKDSRTPHTNGPLNDAELRPREAEAETARRARRMRPTSLPTERMHTKRAAASSTRPEVEAFAREKRPNGFGGGGGVSGFESSLSSSASSSLLLLEPRKSIEEPLQQLKTEHSLLPAETNRSVAGESSPSPSSTSEGARKIGCTLFHDKTYVVYSSLGSFYIPMLIMIFFYSRIYLVASRAQKAMQRGYMTTKWPPISSKAMKAAAAAANASATNTTSATTSQVQTGSTSVTANQSASQCINATDISGAINETTATTIQSSVRLGSGCTDSGGSNRRDQEGVPNATSARNKNAAGANCVTQTPFYGSLKSANSAAAAGTITGPEVAAGIQSVGHSAQVSLQAGNGQRQQQQRSYARPDHCVNPPPPPQPPNGQHVMLRIHRRTTPPAGSGFHNIKSTSLSFRRANYLNRGAQATGSRAANEAGAATADAKGDDYDNSSALLRLSRIEQRRRLQQQLTSQSQRRRQLQRQSFEQRTRSSTARSPNLAPDPDGTGPQQSSAETTSRVAEVQAEVDVKVEPSARQVTTKREDEDEPGSVAQPSDGARTEGLELQSSTEKNETSAGQAEEVGARGDKQAEPEVSEAADQRASKEEEQEQEQRCHHEHEQRHGKHHKHHSHHHSHHHRHHSRNDGQASSQTSSHNHRHYHHRHHHHNHHHHHQPNHYHKHQQHRRTQNRQQDVCTAADEVAEADTETSAACTPELSKRQVNGATSGLSRRMSAAADDRARRQLDDVMSCAPVHTAAVQITVSQYDEQLMSSALDDEVATPAQQLSETQQQQQQRTSESTIDETCEGAASSSTAEQQQRRSHSVDVQLSRRRATDTTTLLEHSDNDDAFGVIEKSTTATSTFTPGNEGGGSTKADAPDRKSTASSAVASGPTARADRSASTIVVNWDDISGRAVGSLATTESDATGEAATETKSPPTNRHSSGPPSPSISDQRRSSNGFACTYPTANVSALPGGSVAPASVTCGVRATAGSSDAGASSLSAAGQADKSRRASGYESSPMSRSNENVVRQSRALSPGSRACAKSTGELRPPSTTESATAVTMQSSSAAGQVRKQSLMLLSTLTSRGGQTLRRLSNVAMHPVESLLHRSGSNRSKRSSCSTFTGDVYTGSGPSYCDQYTTSADDELSSSEFIGGGGSGANELLRATNSAGGDRLLAGGRKKRHLWCKHKKCKGSRQASLAPSGGSSGGNSSPGPKRTFDDFLMAVAGIDNSSDEDDDEFISSSFEDDEDEDEDDEDDDEQFGYVGRRRSNKLHPGKSPKSGAVNYSLISAGESILIPSINIMSLSDELAASQSSQTGAPLNEPRARIGFTDSRQRDDLTRAACKTDASDQSLSTVVGAPSTCEPSIDNNPNSKVIDQVIDQESSRLVGTEIVDAAVSPSTPRLTEPNEVSKNQNTTNPITSNSSGLHRQGGYYERATSRSNRGSETNIAPPKIDNLSSNISVLNEDVKRNTPSNWLVGINQPTGLFAGFKNKLIKDTDSTKTMIASVVPTGTMNPIPSTGIRRRPKRTSRWHAKRLRAETKAAKTVGIIVGGFIFCWLPFFTVYLIRAVICESPDCIPQSLLSLFTWLGYLNSAINPVIYGLFSADFRVAFKNIICRCRFRRHPADDNKVVSALVDNIIKSIL